MDFLDVVCIEECIKKEKIEKFINLMTNSDNPYDSNLQIQYATSVGLDPNTLSPTEIAEIEMRINSLL